jgi:hypothetical protein
MTAWQHLKKNKKCRFVNGFHISPISYGPLRNHTELKILHDWLRFFVTLLTRRCGRTHFHRHLIVLTSGKVYPWITECFSTMASMQCCLMR